jgi:hypothetical protein
MVIQNRQRSLAFVLGNALVATVNGVVNEMDGGSFGTRVTGTGVTCA